MAKRREEEEQKKNTQTKSVEKNTKFIFIIIPTIKLVENLSSILNVQVLYFPLF